MKKTSKDFALVQKNIFKDKRLSWQAKGFLAQALAMGLTEDTLTEKAIMNELEKYGYLIIESDSQGDPIYHFFDDPSDHPQYNSMKKKSDKGKKKGANYKKILSDALGGVKWDTKEYEVHHINHNREDNRVSNLLLLPKKMHQKYHYLMNMIQYGGYDLTSKRIDSPYVSSSLAYELVEVREDMAALSGMQEQCAYAVKMQQYPTKPIINNVINMLLGYYLKYS